MPKDFESLGDLFWAELAPRLLHPVQVQIIEAFRCIEEPLAIRDLVEIVTKVEPVHLDYHVGRLRKLGVLECGPAAPGTDSLDVDYQLVGWKDLL